MNAVDYMEEINIPCQVSKEKLSRECNNYVIELEERREEKEVKNKMNSQENFYFSK